MQPQEDQFIDYSPVPDSPFPDLSTPPLLSPSMRSNLDMYSPLPSRRRRGRRNQRRPRWGDTIREEPDDSRQDQTQELRIVKGKWSRRCRTQSCKNPFRPRPPPPPPPASATSGLVRPQKPIAAHGGTRKNLKNKSKKSKKCKNKHRK